MPSTRRRRHSASQRCLPILAGAVLGAWGLALPLADAAAAQSREVVQQLPPPEASKLNDALRRLARDSRDVGALVDAGTAALQLGDVDAARGFFQRADSLSSSDVRVKAGLASALVRSEQPLRALEMFAQAERLGRVPSEFAPDQGLAFDLVGNNLQAQTHYVRALRSDPRDETRRRLALSQAISGDRRGFETSLIPLLRKRDVASYRVRAFGLAILGDVDEAVAIADAAMPRELAARMAPYLRYMPRLSRAQQAAAANLGVFPQASSIGQDDPRIASYSGSGNAAQASQRLAPTGAPMGSRERVDTRSQRRRPGSPGASQRQTGNTRRVTRAEARRIARRESNDPLSRTAVRRTREVEPSASAPAATPPPPPPPPPTPPPPPPPPSQSTTESASELSRAAELAAADQPTAPEAEAARPSLSIATTSSAEMRAANNLEPSEASNAAGNTEIEEQISFSASVTAPPPPPVPPPPPPPPAVQQAPEQPASLADAFSDFSLPAGNSASPNSGAVDISQIEPPREREEEEQAEPDHPRRVWVQIATGRDRSALRFDWRRFSRKAPDVLEGKGPFVTSWGETNRLLAGPFVNTRVARTAVNDLSEADIDSFIFTSPEGKEIEELQ